VSYYSFKYKTAQEISAATGISDQRIGELCKSGHMPHVYIDGSGPLFSYNDTIAWIRKNLVNKHDGNPIEPLPVLFDANPHDVPRALALLAKKLIHLPACCLSGIYFLCSGNEVVYVGQSIRVGARSHSHRDKKFDTILVLPVPQEDLNRVEAAFIGLLKPKYNKTLHRSGREILHNANGDCCSNPHEVVSAYFAREEAA
jgi:hypothetical protein